MVGGSGRVAELRVTVGHEQWTHALAIVGAARRVALRPSLLDEERHVLGPRGGRGVSVKCARQRREEASGG